jgi:hypothetical protein
MRVNLLHIVELMDIACCAFWQSFLPWVDHCRLFHLPLAFPSHLLSTCTRQTTSRPKDTPICAGSANTHPGILLNLTISNQFSIGKCDYFTRLFCPRFVSHLVSMPATIINCYAVHLSSIGRRYVGSSTISHLPSPTMPS